MTSARPFALASESVVRALLQLLGVIREEVAPDVLIATRHRIIAAAHAGVLRIASNAFPRRSESRKFARFTLLVFPNDSVRAIHNLIMSAYGSCLTFQHLKSARLRFCGFWEPLVGRLEMRRFRNLNLYSNVEAIYRQTGHFRATLSVCECKLFSLVASKVTPGLSIHFRS